MLRKLARKVFRSYIYLFIQLSGLNSVFKLHNKLIARCLDLGSLIWNVVIVVTSYVKLRRPLRSGPPLSTTWADIIVLDSLPSINHYKVIYYGLTFATITITLMWQLYINFFRSSRYDRLRFNPVAELVEFVLQGPKQFSDREDANSLRRDESTLVAGATAPPLRQPDRAYLRRAHERLPPPEDLIFEYTIPIGTDDFLRDKSATRWQFIAWRICIFTAFAIPFGAVAAYLVLGGMLQVNEKFGTPQALLAQDGVWQALKMYGKAEQIFVICQSATILVYTNVFFTMIYADLKFKSRAVCEELATLRGLYKTQTIRTLPVAQVTRQKMRIWAFFHEIEVGDSYLSKVNFAILSYTIVSVTGALLFNKIYDPALRAGAVGMASSGFFSFAYSCWIAGSVGHMSLRMEENLIGIMEKEQDLLSKYEWQRIYKAFFEGGWFRTFTMNGIYPTDIRSFINTSVGVPGICYLVYRIWFQNSGIGMYGV